MARNKYGYRDPRWSRENDSYKELEEVRDLLEQEPQASDIPKEPLDTKRIEGYAFDLIAGNLSIDDVPADYQEAVKDKRFKILRGE